MKRYVNFWKIILDEKPGTRRPHYLREIIDPLSRPVARVEYDENGRLKQTTNATGNSTGISYDLENATQTVLDALGNPTTVVKVRDTNDTDVHIVSFAGGLTGTKVAGVANISGTVSDRNLDDLELLAL